jgi:hypothetical protein
MPACPRLYPSIRVLPSTHSAPAEKAISNWNIDSPSVGAKEGGMAVGDQAAPFALVEAMSITIIALAVLMASRDRKPIGCVQGQALERTAALSIGPCLGPNLKTLVAVVRRLRVSHHIGDAKLAKREKALQTA